MFERVVKKLNSSLRPRILRLFNLEPETEIVIAHYREDLAWVHEYEVAHLASVYHKGQQEPSGDFKKWVSLPNVGRESHTYLTHIIRNYDQLAEVTLFLQGKIDDHIKEGNCFAHPNEYLEAILKKQHAFPHLSQHDDWGRIKHYGKWLDEFQSGKLRPAEKDLGGFWIELFGSPPPSSILINHNACFAVSRHQIHRHPISFYENAISTLNDHANPEESHYFERLWFSIFNDQNRTIAETA